MRDKGRIDADESVRRALRGGSLIYGVIPVVEALRARARDIDRILVAEGSEGKRVAEVMQAARDAHIPIVRVPRAELERLTSGAAHQGVVAFASAVRYADAAELLKRLAERIGTDDPPLALVLDQIEDPRNLGAIVRTAECAGAHGIFIPMRRAVGLTDAVAKTAAGALEHLPVARVQNIARLAEELKERGVWAIGTASDGETIYTEWDWTQPSAIFLGNEGEGLRRLVRERCDMLVRIPIYGRTESLNVSVAAGVILYEAVRQRRLAGKVAG
jgi:23S rRNA (guanosine2251-2'-O)-methyltransferase